MLDFEQSQLRAEERRVFAGILKRTNAPAVLGIHFVRVTTGHRGLQSDQGQTRGVCYEPVFGLSTDDIGRVLLAKREVVKPDCEVFPFALFVRNGMMITQRLNVHMN